MKKIYLLFAILFAILIGYLAFNKWLDYEDNPMTLARRYHTFGNSKIYIIVKTDSSGATVEQNLPLVYAIIEPSESKSSAGLSWRRIGKSSVDLEKYVDKQVYIDGEYYEGTPLLINKPDEDRYGVLLTQPVIEVKSITLIK
jgi:hypothetical protein